MIKKLSYLILVFLLFSSVSSFSQLRWKFNAKTDKPSKNAVYAEVMGSGFLWSINYERQLKTILVRIGGGYGNQDIMVPIVISYPLRVNDGLVLEMGGGVLNKIVETPLVGVTPEKIPDYEIFPTLNLAARFQPPTRGYFFKFAFTPIFDLQQGTESYFFGQEKPLLPFFLWGGVSIGVIF